MDHLPEISLEELARIHVIRGPQFMWLLGAGSSVAAGVASAGQMIDEFKQIIYATAHDVPLAALNLAEPGVRDKLQRFFDQTPGYPSLGDPDEYAQLFEAAWSAPADRRAFIDAKVRQGRPVFGNIGLAVLCALGQAKIVWTTNFDRVHEQACSTVLEPPAQLTVAALDTADIAVQALQQDRFPLYVKLHGDYQSERLKNTAEELRDQDERNRTALVQAGARYGLIVAGYSGRDESLLEALREVLRSTPSPFPAGLYWCRRPGEELHQGVAELLAGARAVGVDARWLPVHTFDELVGRLLNTVSLPDRLARIVEGVRPERRRQPFTVPPRQGRGPRMDFNALPVTSFPSVCRQIECATIGGTKEVRQAIQAAGATAIGARRSTGVIAFGADKELRRAFEPFDIRSWTVGSIATDTFQRDHSSDLGLLYDALAAAIVRQRPLKVTAGRADKVVTVDPVRADDPIFAPLSAALGRVSPKRPPPGGARLVGSLGKDGPCWAEGARLRLSYHFDTMWLIFEPLVWVEHTPGTSNEARELRHAFIGPRTWHRYNQVAAEITLAWAAVLAGSLAALGLPEDDGVDANFTVGERTAMSTRRSR